MGYTGVFNVLDYSCVSFPSGVIVDSALDFPLAKGDEYTPLSETCAAIHAECELRLSLFNVHKASLRSLRQRGPGLSEARSLMHRWFQDNPEAVNGMPVGLQLVARQLEEEKALAMCKVVMANIGNA